MTNLGLSDLQTGNSGVSQTFGNEEVSPAQTEAIEEQRLELAELLPGVDAIKKVLDDEMDAVGDIRGYIKVLDDKAKETHIPVDKDVVFAEYRGRELYIELCKRLKQSIDDKVATAEAEINK